MTASPISRGLACATVFHPAQPVSSLRRRSEILATAVWPILAAVAVGRIAVVMPGARPSLVVTLTAVAFLAVVMLQPAIGRSAQPPEDRRNIVQGRAPWTMALLLTLSGAVVVATGVRGTTAIIVAAAVEEYVFRWVLPRRFFASLAATRISERHRVGISWVMAQMIFAACHFVAPGTLFSLSYAARLFVSGLLYSNLVAKLGVFAAIAVHSAMNAGLERSIGFWSDGMVSGSVLVASAGIALAGLWSNPARVSLVPPNAVHPFLTRKGTL